MASLELQQVTKIFEKHVDAVKNISFTVKDHEFIVLLGPSGCGKTTILRMIAGLEEISQGKIYIAGECVNEMTPDQRDIAMVFQNYALYPHMTAYDNMAFSMRMRKRPKNEMEKRVIETAEILGISDLLKRKPRQLSGGERQRVALGRAIVRQPKLFLFDEPLSNLDAKLRVQMRAEISRLHKRLGATIVYVTHDQIEAMTLGERIVILKAGEIQQIGTPLDIYHRPANRFVASFVGSPPMNFVKGSIRKHDRRLTFRNHAFSLVLTERFEKYLDQPVIIGIRPADFSSARGAELQIVVDVIEPFGDATYVYGKCGDTVLQAKLPEGNMPRVGQPYGLHVDPDKIYLFDGKTEESLK